MRWSVAGTGYARHAAHRRPGEQFAGRGDHTDVAPPAGADLVADPPEPVMLTDALDGLHGGPADQGAALLGDPPTVDLGVGLMVLGSQSGPAGQLAGSGKAVHIPDLGDEHRAQNRPPPPGSPGSRYSRGGHAAGR
jgi:hypothetical protein